MSIRRILTKYEIRHSINSSTLCAVFKRVNRFLPYDVDKSKRVRESDSNLYWLLCNAILKPVDTITGAETSGISS